MDNTLIPVSYDNDRPTVLASDLHNFLGVETPMDKWLPRMFEYGFTEGQDYSTFLSVRSDGRPGRQKRDAQLTIEMAKEICMLQRNEKGKQARQYFIELEKQWNDPEVVMARALTLAGKKIEALTARVAELQPKADYLEKILQSNEALTITRIAKDYGKSAMKMNEMLHERKIQFKSGDQWVLYQKYSNKGYTQSYTATYEDNSGMLQTKTYTKWTQAGRKFIYELLKKDGILPLIEQTA